MTAHTLTDGTPIPEDLAAAHRELTDLCYQSSRVSVVLRDLSGALSDEDEPLPACYRAGLLEAVAMVGDYLEYYASDRARFLEHLVRSEHARKAPEVAPR